MILADQTCAEVKVEQSYVTKLHVPMKMEFMYQ